MKGTTPQRYSPGSFRSFGLSLLTKDNDFARTSRFTSNFHQILRCIVDNAIADTKSSPHLFFIKTPLFARKPELNMSDHRRKGNFECLLVGAHKAKTLTTQDSAAPNQTSARTICDS